MLSPKERRILLKSLDEKDAIALLYDWPSWARPNQLEPPPVMESGEHWTTWLILAGRGYGKTRTGAETINKWAKAKLCSRMALVAEDASDARDVMVEGESGILECSPPDFRPKYEPSKRRLTWPNGARATLYSAEDYDSLRGPQFDGAWCDELCKWRYAQEAWDNLQFGLRLGTHPRQIVTTTPRPIKLLKDIVKRSDTYITIGSTYENLQNLAKPFRLSVVERYAGTRLGQQELDAKILEDVPGALWSRTMLDELRLSRTWEDMKAEFAEIVVAVDPATTADEGSNETGIVVIGRTYANDGVVIADVSMQGSPDQWGRAVVQAHDDYGANRVVYETNQGGDMVAFTIGSCATAMRHEGKRKTDFVAMRGVHASIGKRARAEPVSALYEQKRIRHLGFLPKLEDQMCEFTTDFDRRAMKYSPDRVDSLVWGCTDLLVGDQANAGLFEYYRQESEAVQSRLSGAKTRQLTNEIKVPMVPTKGTGTAYGRDGTRYDLQPDGLMYIREVDVGTFSAAGFKRKELVDG